MRLFRTRAGNVTAPHCREARFISPAVSPRPGFSLLSTVSWFFCFGGFCFCFCFFLSFFPLVGDVALPHQAQRNRSLQQFLAFGGLRMVLRLVQRGLAQVPMAGWERAALLWEGECVLLTEAFITLAAGTSAGGEVLLCGVGLVRLHLTALAGLNCG